MKYESKKMTLSGDVILKRINIGSKQEHEAVMLVTRSGEWRLRRKNKNPFFDKTLRDLVGKSIECDGLPATTTLFFLDKWEEVK